MPAILATLFALLTLAPAQADTREDAIIALGEGRQARAFQLLADGVAAGGDDATELRCLLGRVQHQAGQHREAIQTLEPLPEDALCAMGAAFVRAEAMLALGQEEEAGGIYAALSEQALGTDRDARTAQRLEELADRVLEREQPGHAQAAAALELALQLTVDPSHQLALARRLADLGEQPGMAGRVGAALPVLASAVRGDSEVQDRRRLASLVGGTPGLALLEGLEPSLETQLLRLRLGSQLDLGWQLEQLEALVAAHPQAAQTRQAQLDLGRVLAEQGWRDGAERALAELAGGGDAMAAEAAQLRAQLALAAGDDPIALELLEDLLARFPRSEQRRWAEDQRHLAMRREARRAAGEGEHRRALELLAALAEAGFADDAYDAGLEALAMGEPEEARRRWEEIGARWPQSSAAHRAEWALFRLLAHHRDDPDAAVAWLEARAQAGLADAQVVLDAIEEPSLAIEGGVGEGSPRVRVLSRGHERLELRLHRLDLEAWLRVDLPLEQLPQLDLGIIEPDRRWTVELPGAHPQRVEARELPVALPGPGIYAVTVASEEREAQTLLLHSAATLVAQRTGPWLAAAVFAHGRPVPAARILVRRGGALEEITTDSAGLALAELGSEPLTLLAETPHGPALLELEPTVADPLEREPIVVVDLDRPVHRPGDSLGFRIAVDRLVPVEERDWTLWLEGPAGFTSLARHRFEEREDGTVVGEIPLPLGSTGHSGVAAVERVLTLRAQRPDGTEQALATVRIADDVPQGRQLELRQQGRELRMLLREEGGEPAVGVPLGWTWTEAGTTGRLVTDAQGEALLEGPPAGVPWTVEAVVLGTELRARAWAPAAPDQPWSLLGASRRLGENEALDLNLQGRGEATLRLSRLREAAEPDPIPDAWAVEPRWTEGLEGPVPWNPTWDESQAGVRETVWSQELSLDGDSRAALPGLPSGRYLAELVSGDGQQRASWGFAVVDGSLSLGASPRVGAGQRLSLRLSGEPALVVVGSSDEVRAMVFAPGESRLLAVPTSWRGAVSVVASGVSGATQHQRLELAPALDARLEVEPGSEGWRLRVRVSDAAGRPVRAQVALGALDLALEREVGRATGGWAGALRSGATWSDRGAWSGRLRHGAWASLISSALRAELAREEEARRASRAQHGHLANNAVQAALGQDVPLSLGLGALGTRGHGMGGGGYGGGVGGLIGAKGVAHGGGAARARPLQGERGRVLWTVRDTDDAGVVELTMPTPPRAGSYRLRAVALAQGWVADDEQVVVSEGGQRSPVVSHAPSSVEPLALALAPDPHLAHDPGRAAVAARAILAALPSLGGAGRDEARARLVSLLGAVNPEPARYRSVGEAAQALALLGELDALWTLPRGTAEAFAAKIDPEGAERADRVALVWARVLAGLPVEDASVARLLREPELLEPEQASLLARALIRLERLDEASALIARGGPQAALALREAAGCRESRLRAEEAARALLDGLMPPVGDPSRPAWLAAVLPVAVGEPLPATPPLVDQPRLACATRLPLSADGLPVRVSVLASPEGEPSCVPGLMELAPGDALRLEGDLRLVALPEGLERIPDPSTAGFLLRASQPGEHLVRDIATRQGDLALRVVVGGEALTPVAEPVALAMARQAWAMVGDPTPWLGGRPRLEDWSPGHRAEVARLRFERAVETERSPAELCAAFEDLRDVDPDSSLGFPAVLAVARAYAQLRPDRAVEIQRSAIGAAFLDEASIAHRLERVMGPLAAIQVLREIAGRYPTVPVVEQALYELPDRVLDMGEGGYLPPELSAVGVTATDLRLMSAAWNRELVALHPDSPLAPLAGRRLVVDLLHLGAWERAARWSARLADRHAGHELEDSFLYLEGLARGALGDGRQAAALLRRVSNQRFVRSDGLEGPSELRDDAELALARLLEAEGDQAGAEAAYRAAAGSLDEAEASLLQLQTRALELDELLLLDPREPAVLPVTLAGVDSVFLRAYRLDLRTLFLRDAGLSSVTDVRVAGISPAWSGEHSVRRSPYPQETRLRLPLDSPGAWLVQLHAGDRAQAALVVRSELSLAVADAGSIRRVTVLRRGRPAPGVQVRAIANGEVVAATTDQRGVALVPAYAPTLAFDGPHLAFTRAQELAVVSGSFEGGDELLHRVDARLEQQRQRSRTRNQHIGVSGGAGMEASAL